MILTLLRAEWSIMREAEASNTVFFCGEGTINFDFQFNPIIVTMISIPFNILLRFFSHQLGIMHIDLSKLELEILFANSIITRTQERQTYKLKVARIFTHKLFILLYRWLALLRFTNTFGVAIEIQLN